jgi:hypothetical protein
MRLPLFQLICYSQNTRKKIGFATETCDLRVQRVQYTSFKNSKCNSFSFFFLSLDIIFVPIMVCAFLIRSNLTFEIFRGIKCELPKYIF